ncbi:hypothetical protein LUZ60_017637 [Juncus effusus]|nr:hypothetical protein LUZ60_017637 [Juncus effusus]
MGKSSSNSFFSFCFSFSKKSRYYEDELYDFSPRYVRKIRPSDEDRGYYIGEPDVDRKASDFIARFYESRRTG